MWWYAKKPSDIYEDPILSEELKKIQENFWKKSAEWTCQVYKEKYGINYNIDFFQPFFVQFRDKNFYFKMLLKKGGEYIWDITFFDYEIEKFEKYLKTGDKKDLII